MEYGRWDGPILLQNKKKWESRVRLKICEMKMSEILDLVERFLSKLYHYRDEKKYNVFTDCTDALHFTE